MDFNFSGKVALITGGSAGIGAGIAKLFSQCGANLVLTARNEARLSEVGKECVDLSPTKLKPLLVTADISKEEDNKRTVDSAIKEFGKIDILVNNAAMFVFGGIAETSMQTYEDMMNTNVRSMFHLTKLCMPYLVESKGNIVNISGIGGLRTISGIVMCCISKAAVDQFTRCTALELAPRGVRVNAINPGVVKTDIFKTAGSTQGDYEKILENAKKTHPLQRYGEVEDVASAVAFLASDHASFITGVTLPIDGGKHATFPR